MRTAIFIILVVIMVIELFNTLAIICVNGHFVNAEKNFKDALESFGAGFASGLKKGQTDGTKQDKAD